MSTITKGTITSNTNNDRYGYTFDSIYSTMLKPQIYGEYIKRFGKGVGLLEFLYLTGSTVSVAGPSKTVWEEGSLTKLVKLNGAIATQNAGVDITFSLDAAEFDANHHCYLNINDIIIIPAEYIEEGGVAATIPHGYQVVSVDDVTQDDVKNIKNLKYVNIDIYENYKDKILNESLIYETSKIEYVRVPNIISNGINDGKF